ncbi:MAG: hypothetical protein IKW30_10700 [Lachnospiraceae bacterium]|nr:hypothetical protein [Lachnospiraceae bacterium]
MGLSISLETVSELRDCATSLRQNNKNITDRSVNEVLYYKELKNSLGPHVDKIEKYMENVYDTSIEAQKYIEEMAGRLENLAKQIETFIMEGQG